MGEEGADAPVLAMFDEWVIDVATRDRMARQLARAPENVSGIVAEVAVLQAGASYRAHAERSALQPFSATSDTGSRYARGAVLVRPGVGFGLRGEVVEVDSGTLLVDHGAHVHDPWHPVDPLETATPLGRPPFSWRPVVLLIACEDDRDLADWARSLANDLVRLDVEARVAIPEATEGMHLTRPCLPTAATVRGSRQT